MSDKNKQEHKLINNKASKWLIFFFPYGIYYMLKNKAYNVYVRTLILIFISLFTIGVIDKIVYPERLLDYQVEKALKDYTNTNKEIGKYRNVEKLKTDKDLKEKRYFLYTTNDKYLVFVSLKDKKTELSGIFEIGKEHKEIFKEKSFIINKDIYPEIFAYIKDNKLGKIDKVEYTKGNCQDITIDNKKYRFIVDWGRVVKIYEYINDSGKKDLKKIYSKPSEELILPQIKRIFKKSKKYGEPKILLKYEFEKDRQIQYIITTNGAYKFEVLDDNTVKIYKGQ